MAMQIFYTPVGSTEQPRSMAVQDGITVGEFIADVLDVPLVTVDVTLNGHAVENMDSDLTDGAIIGLVSKKQKSGV